MSATDNMAAVQPRFVPFGEQTGEEEPDVVFVIDVRTLDASERIVIHGLRRSIVVVGGLLNSFPDSSTIDIEFAKDATFFDRSPFVVLTDLDFVSDDIPVSAGRRPVVRIRGGAGARHEPVVHVRNCREMDTGFVESCFLETANVTEVVVENCHLTSSSPCFRWLPSESRGVARIHGVRIVLRGDKGRVVETGTRPTFFSDTTVYASTVSAPFGETASVLGGGFVFGNSAECFGACRWKPAPPEEPDGRTFPTVTQDFLSELVRCLFRMARSSQSRLS